MTPNELRIGNILFIPGLNKYVVVDAIFKTYFRCDGLDGVSYDESVRVNYQPIPLTPELLEKINEDVINGIELRNLVPIWVNEIDNQHKPTIHFLGANGLKIEFLHQLQMYYYVRSGFKKELEINL